MKKQKKKSFKEYMWISSAIYLLLGFFNILFAWLGLICFVVPILLAGTGKGKIYCNEYCGRGQLFDLLGKKFKLSRHKPIPSFIRTKWFRYGFLIFFMTMFGNMIYTTYLVFSNTKQWMEIVTLLWTFKLPWHFATTPTMIPWMGQFALGLYSLMLTSSVLGLITMLLYKPRAWCVYCPMGTMTQGICQLKNRE